VQKNQENNIAMLIDCDNVSAKYIDSILNDLSKYGVVNIRNAYGNWKDPKLKGWEEALQEHAIKPIQQFGYTKGKNATDIAMIIDIMDILYTKELSAIALITSDSDFTPVVTRILADGLKVYGYGEFKTPDAFVNACSQFIYAEKLYETSHEESKDQEESQKIVDRKALRKDTKLVYTLRRAVEQSSDDAGWANISAVGKYISQNSSFSPINYGYLKLSHLIKATDLFDIRVENKNSVMLIRDKRYW